MINRDQWYGSQTLDVSTTQIFSNGIPDDLKDKHDGEDFNRSIKCGSTIAATSKMEHFVITVNGFQPLNIIIKLSILDVAAVLDSSLADIIEKKAKVKGNKRSHYLNLMTCQLYYLSGFPCCEL